MTVTTGANSTITTTANPASDGIHLEDFTKLADSGTMTVVLGNNTTINAGHTAVFVGQNDINSNQPVIVTSVATGFLQLTGSNGGSGVDAHTAGTGGVLVETGSPGLRQHGCELQDHCDQRCGADCGPGHSCVFDWCARLGQGVELRADRSAG